MYTTVRKLPVIQTIDDFHKLVLAVSALFDGVSWLCPEIVPENRNKIKIAIITCMYIRPTFLLYYN